MTESQFIEKNREKWRELEALLDQSVRDADKLHTLFIRVSSDLSYARTFYPNRSVRLYLNNLTQRVFDSMTRAESKTNLATIFHFFKYTLPAEVINAKTAFIVSFLIFVVSVAIGIVSTANNPDFARIILGDHYIQITDENINAGDPMAIYKDEQQVDMFLGITINNIKVAFIAFVLGLMGTMGTVFILMYNGIMLGAFQYYFYSKGLFMTSFLTIWIHGTIEISAIIIAGAAGIVLGSGLLFPNTYDRLVSLQMSAKKALIIVLGTIPLFVIAGLLESFVTRHTEFPAVVKVAIIIGSVILILSMWVIFPMRLKARNALMDTTDAPTPEYQPELSFQSLQYRDLGESFVLAFAQIRQLMGPYLKIIVIPSVLIFGLLNAYHLNTLDEVIFELDDSAISLFHFQYGGVSNFVFFWITLTLVLLLFGRYTHHTTTRLDLVYIKQYFIVISILSLVLVFLLYFLPLWLAGLLILVFSPQFFIILNTKLLEDDFQARPIIEKSYRFSIQYYGRFLSTIVIVALFYGMLTLLFNSGLSSIITTYWSWHEIFDFQFLDELFISHLLTFLAMLLVFPLAYFLIISTYYSELCRTEALDLRNKFETFGQTSTILEPV